MKKLQLTAWVSRLMLACSLFCCSAVLAQTNGTNPSEISGTVSSASSGQKIAGATVTLVGDNKVATTTDNNGDFKLKIPSVSGAIELLITHVNFERKQVKLEPGQSTILIQLNDPKALDEVVVTALGIKKEKKALAYAVTEVKGDEFTQAREINIANALTGKIAGVNASSIASGPGGSSRVIIRGNGSLNGDNQPLYVVNGMPIDNTTNSTIGSSGSSTGINNDKGDGIAGINPDDIESMTVLKGGTAAALYGSRASNGVIIITTKKGVKQKGIGVEYNSSLTAERPAIIPDWQYEYGSGQFGLKPKTQKEAIDYGRLSYGEKMDGSDVIQFDGVKRPYSPQKNNIKNFYRTGTTFTNTVSFYGGSDNFTWRASVSDMNNKGLVPNSKLNKKIATLSINANLSKKLSMEGYAQYNIEKSENRSTVSDANANPNWGTYMIANTVDIRSLNPGYDADGNEVAWQAVAFASNPYYVVNKVKNNDQRNRFIGNFSVKYNLLNNLFVKGRVSHDYSNLDFTGVVPTGNLFAPSGFYQNQINATTETNAELTINYNTKITSDLSVNVLAGGNQRRFTANNTALNGTGFTVPGFFDISSVTSLAPSKSLARLRTNSIFGSVDFSFKNYLYLTASGRNDWFSTLSIDNNNIFYPAIGASFIVSEALQLPSWVNFAKVRASIAQVGGATPIPYALNRTYSLVPGTHEKQALQVITNQNGVTGGNLLVPNKNLKPLTSTTAEIGIEGRLLNGRVSFDVAVYERKTTNDIVSASISPSTGYTNALFNVGEMTNKGIEFLVTGVPFKSKNFQWEVSYNFAYNKNEVVKITDDLHSIEADFSVNRYAYIHHREGRPYSSVMAFTEQRDSKGNIVYDKNNGREVRNPNMVEMGTGVAPFTTGITNTFNYKRFSLSFLIDGKFGGVIYSGTNLYGSRMGLHKITLPGREGGLVVSGVDASGNPFTRTLGKDEIQGYYNARAAISDKFVYSSDFVKLRQVIIGYSIPVQKISFLKLQALTVSLVGRNLFFIHKDAPNIDPESTFSNSNAQGLEMFGVPRTRSYGINLQVKF
ncbi:SusC/RagA family TonB-linked outer membrane protein [Pseudoflavitalea sp. G-6-1-2]|uniref:SusC/RagA family TonB-linked outer membrane protein n=1 Tax=Pseudoflavitalea sp. G-6-1-2 TaxID=2728841 RepID=UPI00146EC712|nr:SusC/RagA family TonB-linked outer membrane protein [Pseudoflavitalea sp. G-6-1-2]NML20073.1 SusC/RagA family TonB-linked outer membrane protein [Pseudoflavitalea sp. G-6-1-2]